MPLLQAIGRRHVLQRLRFNPTQRAEADRDDWVQGLQVADIGGPVAKPEG